ncbi:MAG: hypothetical protein R2746_05905 [Acidimicrobiales bacterium]
MASLATRGPLTPDHVIRTKRVALVGRDVHGYAAEYEAYVARNRHRARTELVALDPAPRVVVDPELGVLAAGPTVADARIAGDIYRHTMPVLERAEDHLGGYVALPGRSVRPRVLGPQAGPVAKGGSSPGSPGWSAWSPAPHRGSGGRAPSASWPTGRAWWGSTSPRRSSTSPVRRAGSGWWAT